MFFNVFKLNKSIYLNTSNVILQYTIKIHHLYIFGNLNTSNVILQYKWLFYCGLKVTNLNTSNVILQSL